MDSRYSGFDEYTALFWVEKDKETIYIKNAPIETHNGTDFGLSHNNIAFVSGSIDNTKYRYVCGGITNNGDIMLLLNDCKKNKNKLFKVIRF